MARLTSRQRQAVIARYLAGESIASLAKEYNISRQALAKQVKQEKVAESLQKVTNEQALTMAAFIQSKKEQTQDIIEAMLDKLQDKIDKAQRLSLKKKKKKAQTTEKCIFKLLVTTIKSRNITSMLDQSK